MALTMEEETRALAAAYFRAWKEHDFEALRSVLADDVSFRGPLGTADDAATCMQGLRHMAKMIDDIVVHKVFVDGADVLTWFDLHMSGGQVLPTVNWSHVENGRIAKIRAVFDPRPILPANGR